MILCSLGDREQCDMKAAKDWDSNPEGEKGKDRRDEDVA
jgi:hypothetical protein